MSRPELSNPNFIVLYLCDNDFGWELEEVAKLLQWTFGQEPILPDESRVKAVAIDLMLALHNLRDAANGRAEKSDGQLRSYLTGQLGVAFAQHRPTVDHDGGSVCIDRNLRGFWRF